MANPQRLDPQAWDLTMPALVFSLILPSDAKADRTCLFVMSVWRAQGNHAIKAIEETLHLEPSSANENIIFIGVCGPNTN
mmetsp:Transcript_86755/g.149675  ORF Transcript_86755/g.149675 Transcript_86755/m.149675 type:complete len:80 (-) Transcript_86755:153-392(-)